MGKTVILLLTLIIIIFGFLSGCNENKNPEFIDTDGDGYYDNEDDFPSDSNLHEKIFIISNSATYQQQSGGGGDFDVDGDCKFFVVNWEVTNPTNLTDDEQKNILFHIQFTHNENFRTNYSYDNKENRNLSFNIDFSNIGKCEYGFTNINVSRDVTIYREIYMIK